MRSALGVRFLALFVAAAALLSACKKEGDTIIVSDLPPEVKEIFVGTANGNIYSITPEGAAATFYLYPTASPRSNGVVGLAWHAGENRLYSCVSPTSSDSTRRGRIFVHAADGTPTEFASTVPGVGGELRAQSLAVSPVDGKLYCGTDNGLIIRWDGPNTGTVVHTGAEGSAPVPVWALVIDPMGRIFYTTGGTASNNQAVVRRVTGSSSYETWLTIPGLNDFFGVASDSAGRVYVTEFFNDKVYRLLSPSANQEFLSFPWVDRPVPVAVDAQGNFWIGEDYGFLKAFDPNGFRLVPYPIASGLGNVNSIALRH